MRRVRGAACTVVFPPSGTKPSRLGQIILGHKDQHRLCTVDPIGHRSIDISRHAVRVVPGAQACRLELLADAPNTVVVASPLLVGS